MARDHAVAMAEAPMRKVLPLAAAARGMVIHAG